MSIQDTDLQRILKMASAAIKQLNEADEVAPPPANKPWPHDNVHDSHVMTEWKSSIVTLPNRRDLVCGAEHARTAAGEGMHDELKVPCLYVDTID